MKTIQPKTINFQKLYASDFMTLILTTAAFEIFTLVVVILGGVR